MTHTTHLIGNVLLLVSAAIFLIMSGMKTWQAKRAQKRLIDEADAATPWHPWFRVSLSRPAYFMKWLKWVPFEAKGVLVFAPDIVRLRAEMPSGEKIDLSIPQAQLNVEWIGPDGVRNGHRSWFRLGHASHSYYATADVRIGTNPRVHHEATADLCRRLAPDAGPQPLPLNGYALEKNPASLTVAVAFFVLLFYALFDFIANSHELVNDDRVRWLMPFMMVAAVPCYFWMTKRQVPAAESTALAILLGIVMSAAFYPAVKRVDQLLSDGPHPYEYRLAADKTLEPLGAEVPKLDYAFRDDYWAQFETGSIHTFDLLHGPMGLWQVDRSGLRNAMRDFYGRAGPPKHE
jgi:hypothetical protein